MPKRTSSLSSKDEKAADISADERFEMLKKLHDTENLQKKGGENSFDLLEPDLLNLLHDLNIFDPFPVQNETIPIVLNEANAYDVCISAPTGSGKTLAYVLPILNLIKDRLVARLQCIVVLPTKDLVSQVESVFKRHSSGFSVNIFSSVGGGRSFAEEQDLIFSRSADGSVESKIDVLVCTPMRLLDHLGNSPDSLFENVRILVFDEADRLFDTIESTEWYFTLLKKVNAEQRTSNSLIIDQFVCPLKKLFFSATLSRNPAKLTGLKLNSPQIINISPEKYSIPATLQEHYCVVTDDLKLASMLYFVQKNDFKKVLCFTNSNDAAEKLSFLANSACNYSVGSFSGQKSLQERKTILKAFDAGSIRLLICSDGISRGMDFTNVDCVINFELPNFIKTYMHRIGRTARARNSGCAFSIVTKKEVKDFLEMLQKAIRTESPIILDFANDSKFTEFAEKISKLANVESISKNELEVMKILKSQF